jgi:oligosaccharide repeat unit polymerase
MFSAASDTDLGRAGGAYRWWFGPAVLVLVPAAVSFLAWVVLLGVGSPGSRVAGARFELRGFDEPASVSLPGVTLLVLWYGAVVLFSVAGWRLGINSPPAPGIVERTSAVSFERRYFLLVLTVALIGTTYAFYMIASTTSILGSINDQTANALREAVPSSAGVATLRYAAILAAPIGVYLWRKKVIRPIYGLTAVALLLLNAMISSRLALIMACVVYLAIWVRSTRRNSRSAGPWKIIATALMIFVALTALNYIRNGNYYRVAGVSNPIEMNLYQMGSYLAVPAQVSLGVSDAVMSDTFDTAGDPVGSLRALQPTFLNFKKTGLVDELGAGSYGYSVSFATNFTTNSVFADTYRDYGLWGWLYTLPFYAVAGFLFARLIRYGPVVAGSAGVLAYCLAEVWRTQMLTQGIVIFLLLLTLACAGGRRLAGDTLGGQRERIRRVRGGAVFVLDRRVGFARAHPFNIASSKSPVSPSDSTG